MINSGSTTNKSYQTKTVIMLFGFLCRYLVLFCGKTICENYIYIYIIFINIVFIISIIY